jgi:hypothetical protein
VLARADPGLYGGCLQQNCETRQLVWLTIGIVHAAPGKTLADRMTTAWSRAAGWCLVATAGVAPGRLSLAILILGYTCRRSPV